MNFIKQFLLFIIFIIIVKGNNLTEWSIIRRNRRALIFQTSGTVKFVGGITFPVALDDPIPYRQVLVAYNMQAQYSLPTTAAQLYPPWTGRLLEESKIKYDKYNSYVNDQSKNFIYTILEVFFNKSGQNGKICLQKAICENGQIDVADGLFAEIIKTILTPFKSNCDKDFYDAYQAGRFGINCTTLYPECKPGNSFLDKLIFIK